MSQVSREHHVVTTGTISCEAFNLVVKVAAEQESFRSRGENLSDFVLFSEDAISQ